MLKWKVCKQKKEEKENNLGIDNMSSQARVNSSKDFINPVSAGTTRNAQQGDKTRHYPKPWLAHKSLGQRQNSVQAQKEKVDEGSFQVTATAPEVNSKENSEDKTEKNEASVSRSKSLVVQSTTPKSNTSSNANVKQSSSFKSNISIDRIRQIAMNTVKRVTPAAVAPAPIASSASENNDDKSSAPSEQPSEKEKKIESEKDNLKGNESQQSQINGDKSEVSVGTSVQSKVLENGEKGEDRASPCPSNAASQMSIAKTSSGSFTFQTRGSKSLATRGKIVHTPVPVPTPSPNKVISPSATPRTQSPTSSYAGSTQSQGKLTKKVEKNTQNKTENSPRNSRAGTPDSNHPPQERISSPNAYDDVSSKGSRVMVRSMPSTKPPASPKKSVASAGGNSLSREASFSGMHKSTTTPSLGRELSMSGVHSSQENSEGSLTRLDGPTTLRVNSASVITTSDADQIDRQQGSVSRQSMNEEGSEWESELEWSEDYDWQSDQTSTKDDSDFDKNDTRGRRKSLWVRRKKSPPDHRRRIYHSSSSEDEYDLDSLEEEIIAYEKLWTTSPYTYDPRRRIRTHGATYSPALTWIDRPMSTMLRPLTGTSTSSLFRPVTAASRIRSAISKTASSTYRLSPGRNSPSRLSPNRNSVSPMNTPGRNSPSRSARGRNSPARDKSAGTSRHPSASQSRDISRNASASGTRNVSAKSREKSAVSNVSKEKCSPSRLASAISKATSSNISKAMSNLSCNAANHSVSSEPQIVRQKSASTRSRAKSSKRAQTARSRHRFLLTAPPFIPVPVMVSKPPRSHMDIQTEEIETMQTSAASAATTNVSFDENPLIPKETLFSQLCSKVLVPSRQQLSSNMKYLLHMLSIADKTRSAEFIDERIHVTWEAIMLFVILSHFVLSINNIVTNTKGTLTANISFLLSTLVFLIVDIVLIVVFHKIVFPWDSLISRSKAYTAIVNLCCEIILILLACISITVCSSAQSTVFLYTVLIINFCAITFLYCMRTYIICQVIFALNNLRNSTPGCWSLSRVILSVLCSLLMLAIIQVSLLVYPFQYYWQKVMINIGMVFLPISSIFIHFLVNITFILESMFEICYNLSCNSAIQSKISMCDLDPLTWPFIHQSAAAADLKLIDIKRLSFWKKLTSPMRELWVCAVSFLWFTLWCSVVAVLLYTDDIVIRSLGICFIFVSVFLNVQIFIVCIASVFVISFFLMLFLTYPISINLICKKSKQKNLESDNDMIELHV